MATKPVWRCLNPYSTGSNSNIWGRIAEDENLVLILILLEVTQIKRMRLKSCSVQCLNPYSTGSNSNWWLLWLLQLLKLCLNPYSTGSNSNLISVRYLSRFVKSLNPYSTGSNSNWKREPWRQARVRCVLILILLEVTQIFVLYFMIMICMS